MAGRGRDKRIFRRKGSPYYYGRIKEGGRWIPHTLGTTDYEIARLKFAELERGSVDPNYKAANQTSLGAAVVDFKTSRIVKGCAEGTMHMYGIKCAHLLTFFGKDMPMSQLEPPRGAPRVDGYIAARLKAGAKRGTIGKELTALRGVLKTAKRAGKFSGDLDAVLPDGWANDYEPRRTVLTPAQVDALVKALAEPRAWTDSLGKSYKRERTSLNAPALVAFIVATGARWSEAMRATRAQIDFVRGLVYFGITKTRRKGKKEKYIAITRLNEALLKQVVAAVPKTGPMFTPWANAVRDLAILCAELEIPRVTPNDLRRTFINWHREAGVDMQSLSDMAGHTDSRMVERVYGKLRPEQLRERVLGAMH